MAEGGVKNGRRSEQRQRHRAQGAAVAALNAFTAAHEAEAREELGLAAPQDAIRELAAAADDDALHVPRLFVLDSLVKLASRPVDVQPYGAEVDRLLKGLARGAGVPGEEVEDTVAAARDALDSVDPLRDGAEADRPWPAFAAKVADALRLTPTEVEKPLCDDTQIVRKAGHEARGVTVEFHTDAAPGDLRGFCDPRRWYRVSAYQHRMRAVGGPDGLRVERPDGGWRRDLVERVELTPKTTLVTPLRFTYSIERETDPRWVHLDYVLLRETEDIAVDEGSLDVRRVTNGMHKGRTRVSAKKAIFFKNPIFQDWTTIACDTFWTDTVIAAAVDATE